MNRPYADLNPPLLNPRDVDFLLYEWLDVAGLCDRPRYCEHSMESFNSVLDLAADIAQEVWIQIFRALPSYRGDSQFSTWAHRIAVNRTLNALRKTRRLASVETEVTEDSAFVEQEHDRTFVQLRKRPMEDAAR